MEWYHCVALCVVWYATLIHAHMMGKCEGWDEACKQMKQYRQRVEE